MKANQDNPTGAHLGIAGRIAQSFIDSKLTLLIVIASLLLGVFAVVMLPREEEPQIKVPMVDVLVSMPGFHAKEVEERATRPMEKLLWEIPGVEYIYSTRAAAIQFFAGVFQVGGVERPPGAPAFDAGAFKINAVGDVAVEAGFNELESGNGYPFFDGTDFFLHVAFFVWQRFATEILKTVFSSSGLQTGLQRLCLRKLAGEAPLQSPVIIGFKWCTQEELNL